MRQIDVKELNDNFIESIGKEWMLVTAGNKRKFNTMTASWGGVGFLWNKPVVFVFIRPERYTYGFMEEEERFTLSFLGSENQRIHKICGTKSGREVDKIKETGLLPLFTGQGGVTFEQSRLTLECKKLYATDLNPEAFIDKHLLQQWYGGEQGGIHRMYIAEIEHIYVRG